MQTKSNAALCIPHQITQQQNSKGSCRRAGNTEPIHKNTGRGKGSNATKENSRTGAENTNTRAQTRMQCRWPHRGECASMHMRVHTQRQLHKVMHLLCQFSVQQTDIFPAPLQFLRASNPKTFNVTEGLAAFYITWGKKPSHAVVSPSPDNLLPTSGQTLHKMALPQRNRL